MPQVLQVLQVLLDLKEFRVLPVLKAAQVQLVLWDPQVKQELRVLKAM